MTKHRRITILMADDDPEEQMLSKDALEESRRSSLCPTHSRAN